MASPKRCNIDIEVEKSPGSNGNGEEDVFTSGSVIRGLVTITATRTTVVAAVDVSLTGVTIIALDSIGDFRSSRHQFLALKMPPLDRYLPPNGVLAAGANISIPFDFTVPHRLSISACIHSDHSRWSSPDADTIERDTIERHTRPPPSSGSWGSQDKIPGRTRISYDISAEVALVPESSDSIVSDTIFERAKRPVSVLPSLPEDPPLHPSAWGHGAAVGHREDVGQHDVEKADACVCSTKKVHGSRFRLGLKRSVGTVTAIAKQPRAVRLTSDGDGALGSCAHVRFEFLPSRAGAAPPEIRVKSGKMLSKTKYTWTDSKLQPRSEQSAHRTYAHHSVHPIMCLSPENAEWASLDLEQARGQSMGRRRSSASSGPTQRSTSSTIRDDDDDDDDGSSVHDAAAAGVYTTTLAIPFALLKKGPGFHVPTFHSCLISRAYTLQLTFAVGAAKSNISLVVPLQVSVQGSNNPGVAEPGPPSFSSVVAEDDDDAEQPGNENGNANENPTRLRSVSIDEMQHYSGVLPPQYDSG